MPYTALVEQSAAAAHSLREQAQRLSGAVQVFKLVERAHWACTLRRRVGLVGLMGAVAAVRAW